ncbi:rep protein [Circoviridae sp.]|nr:rep protein [Circoviridae sp.]
MSESQKSQAKGNTNLGLKRHRSYMFTINNYTEDDESQISQYFESYVYQYEVGVDGKVPHIQGYCEFKNQVTFSSIKKMIPRAHFEPRRGTRAQAIAYCTKIETRTGGPFSKGIPIPKPIKTISVFYDWQKAVLEMIDQEPDDRTIIWIYEHEGNAGKTALAKYLAITRKALYVSGKSNDIKYAVSEAEHKDIIILDVPRCNQDYISYEAIESVKNGIFFCGKYESKQVIFNSPHLIVFSNEKPDTTKLSEDRWKIYKISEGKLLAV